MQATRFRFTSSVLDRKTCSMMFFYTCDFADRNSVSFSERITFPEDARFDHLPPPLLKKLQSALHLTLGVSYWKTYAPREIDTGTIRLSASEAQYWTTLYTIGMGEYYYRNKLDFRSHLQFPGDASLVEEYYKHPLQGRALTGIGGGKDSIIAAELLRAGNVAQAGFQVEQNGQTTSTDAVVSAIGIPPVKVMRTMDPKLRELPDALNGHVPVSAIYALLGVAAAILLDYRYVIVANERSANEGTVEYLGEMINHQWSKTLCFEQLFRNYVHHFITPDVEYFSLLRPLSELKIMELFVKYPRYFPVFTSCNRNFRLQTGAGSLPLWCGLCAKCAFTYLMLAAYLDAVTVQNILGKNMLADPDVLPIYRELLGLTGVKPFDCVGTVDEVKAAFALILRRGQHGGTPAIELFRTEILEKGFEPSLAIHRALQSGGEHCIPAALLPVLHGI